MFVATGATHSLREKRKESFYKNFIESLITEAKRLNLNESDIKKLIERGFEE